MRVPTRRYETESQRKKKLDYYLTPAAIARLTDELARLESTDLLVALKEMQRTAANGDFSENAEYQFAKSEVRRINNRILSLKYRLVRAIPIAPGADHFGQVEIGTTVTLEVKGREVTYEIVGSQETSPGRGRISYLSPLGTALMHHKEGEKVTFMAGVNKVEYKIIKVS